VASSANSSVISSSVAVSKGWRMSVRISAARRARVVRSTRPWELIPAAVRAAVLSRSRSTWLTTCATASP
jgi:hypothetical protein